MKRCPLIDDVELPLNAEVRRRFGWLNISQSFPTTAEVMSLKGCRLACFHLAPEIPLKRRFYIQLLKEWLNSGCKSGHIKANLRHTLSLNFVFLLKKNNKTQPYLGLQLNSIHIWDFFFHLLVAASLASGPPALSSRALTSGNELPSANLTDGTHSIPGRMERGMARRRLWGGRRR